MNVLEMFIRNVSEMYISIPVPHVLPVPHVHIYECIRNVYTECIRDVYIYPCASCTTCASYMERERERERTRENHWNVQPIPLGVTFSNAVSKLKAQSSNVSFH